MPHIRTDKQPVTQITVIESEPEKQSEALSLMTERARFMSRQPGFVSISLHRSLDGRSTPGARPNVFMPAAAIGRLSDIAQRLAPPMKSRPA